MLTVRLPKVATFPIMLLLGISAATAADTASVLDSFLGRDLFRQRPTEAERTKLNEILGQIPEGYDSLPSPWHVWKTEDSGHSRYIVLLAGLAPTIPGGASACILLLDSGGHRMNISSFAMKYSDDLGGYLVDISTTPVINGGHIANEYFAVRNNHVQFIRLEDHKGLLVQNSYEYPNWQIGAIPEAIGIEDWRALLESREPSDVLSALVFLGGKHLEHNNSPENIAHESSALVERDRRPTSPYADYETR